MLGPEENWPDCDLQEVKRAKSPTSGRFGMESPVRRALRPEADGVDSLIGSGQNCRGLLSKDELPATVLMSQVADALEIVVIGARGIADTRGVVAAFAPDANGLQTGTALLTARGCAVDDNHKPSILSSGDAAPTVMGRERSISPRVSKNEFSERVSR